MDDHLEYTSFQSTEATQHPVQKPILLKFLPFHHDSLPEFDILGHVIYFHHIHNTFYKRPSRPFRHLLILNAEVLFVATDFVDNLEPKHPQRTFPS